MRIKKEIKIRIFHVECPGPLDLFDGTAEAPVLRSIAPLVGHQIHSRTVSSAKEFKDACSFLGGIGDFDDNDSDFPLVLHISAHGHGTGAGISFGKDISWETLVRDLEPFVTLSKSYPGKRIVVLSACDAARQTVTKILKKNKTKGRVPLDYLFCTEKAVGWGVAAVAWTLFYYLLGKSPDLDKASVKHILKNIHLSVGIRLHYWRWNDRKGQYMHWSPETA